MTKSDRSTPLTISLQIPTYWTPEQAFAVFELVDELRETIWRCYALQLQQEYRDQRRHHDADYDPIEPTICRSDLQSNSKGPIGPFRCDCTTFARIHTATNIPRHLGEAAAHLRAPILLERGLFWRVGAILKEFHCSLV